MIVGKPPEEIVDRKEEVGKIVDAMTNPKTNVNYALIGHRRIGKSTILAEAKRQLGKQLIVAYIDFGEFRYSPMDLAETLTERLTEAYAKTLPRSSRLLNAITGALTQLAEIKRLRARFIASIDNGKPIIQIDPYIKDREENYTKALKDVFDYANKISEASKKRVVIIIDEFQHIIDYKKIKELENILDLLRAVLERRKNVSFIVSGSRIHYLRNVLGEGGSPLFGHFVIMEVKEFAKEHVVELFLKSCPKAKKEDAEEAYELVGGHPFYLVMLGEARKANERVKDTYRRILTSATGVLYLYVNYLITEDLGSNYKDTSYPRILMSLAKGEKTISEIANDASLKLTSLPKSLTTLIEYDLVQKIEGKYSVVDRVIRDFFYLQSST